MPGVDLFLVPYDGSLEKRLSASEAKSQQTIEDPVRETRLSELLDQRGVDVRFMFTERGVLMHGSAEQAMVVNRLVSDLPSLAPSANAVVAANDAKKAHIVPVFGDVARPFRVAPLSGAFTMAANDEAPRKVAYGQNASISGSHHMRLAA